MVRDRQKLWDRKVLSEKSFVVEAREWVGIRWKGDGELLISWRMGGGDWHLLDTPGNALSLSLFRAGNRILLFPSQKGTTMESIEP